MTQEKECTTKTVSGVIGKSKLKRTNLLISKPFCRASKKKGRFKQWMKRFTMSVKIATRSTKS